MARDLQSECADKVSLVPGMDHTAGVGPTLTLNPKKGFRCARSLQPRISSPPQQRNPDGRNAVRHFSCYIDISATSNASAVVTCRAQGFCLRLSVSACSFRVSLSLRGGLWHGGSEAKGFGGNVEVLCICGLRALVSKILLSSNPRASPMISLFSLLMINLWSMLPRQQNFNLSPIQNPPYAPKSQY